MFNKIFKILCTLKSSIFILLFISCSATLENPKDDLWLNIMEFLPGNNKFLNYLIRHTSSTDQINRNIAKAIINSNNIITKQGINNFINTHYRTIKCNILAYNLKKELDFLKEENLLEITNKKLKTLINSDNINIKIYKKCINNYIKYYKNLRLNYLELDQQYNFIQLNQEQIKYYKNSHNCVIINQKLDLILKNIKKLKNSLKILDIEPLMPQFSSHLIMVCLNILTMYLCYNLYNYMDDFIYYKCESFFSLIACCSLSTFISIMSFTSLIILPHIALRIINFEKKDFIEKEFNNLLRDIKSLYLVAKEKSNILTRANNLN